MSIKNWVAAPLFQIYQFFPKKIRRSLVRQGLQLSQKYPTQLEFKIAESTEEYESAFKIWYDYYIEAHKQNPESTKIKVLKHFSLPTTTVFIAKWDGAVVGMTGLVRKAAFGMPLECAFDLSEIEKAGESAAELLPIIFSERFEDRFSTLFFPFLGFLYSYIKTHTSLDKLFLVVRPSSVNLYQSLLDFHLLPNPFIKKYENGNKYPAVGLWLDVKTWEMRLKNLYQNLLPENNLYEYLIQQSLKNSKFSESEFVNGMGPIMSPAMLNLFFRVKSQIFDQLTEKEILALYSCYPQKSYALVLPKLSESDFRRSTRFVVHAEGSLNNGKAIRVMEVSESGIRLQGPLPRRTNFEFRVKVGGQQECKLQGLIHWIDQEKNFYGVQILNSDSAWKDYVNSLKADFEKRKHQGSEALEPAPAIPKTAVAGTKRSKAS